MQVEGGGGLQSVLMRPIPQLFVKTCEKGGVGGGGGCGSVGEGPGGGGGVNPDSLSSSSEGELFKHL